MNLDWKTGILLHDDPEAEKAANARLDPQLRALIEKNDTDKVEDLFLTRIEEAPLDLVYFVSVIRHFTKSRTPDKAETLFSFVLEAFVQRNLRTELISLLRALMKAWPESSLVRTTMLEQLALAFPDARNITKLAGHCGIMTAPDPLPAFRTLESWLRYPEGRGVYLPSKGVAKVKEANPAMNAIRVIFPGDIAPMSFRPDEAVRLLEPLEPGHFLLDKLERLHDLRKLTSGDLLIRLFTSIKRHCSLSEIKELLSGIVPAAEWNAWWTAAKKDRRLTVSMDNVCSWNDSADDADAVIMRQFDAADPRSRMALLKIHANRSPQQAAQMIAGLVTDAHASAEPDPGLSLELFLSAGTNQSDTNGGALRALLCRSNIEEIVRGIEDRYLRKKAIVLIREVNDAWPGIYCHLLKTEGDMQTLTLLYDALSDAANCRLGDLVRETLSLPALAPDFFIWLCRELFSRPELVQFADWQFIQLVVRLLSDTAMKKQNGALRKLFDTDSTVHVLARKLDPGQARQFIALLERDSQLEEYRRVAMLKDLYAWYPATQVIEDRTFFVTPRILQARQEEFLKITAVDIPENTEEIMKARAHGDLKENFEYHAARARQEMLSSRAKTLHDQLQLARPIDPAKIDTAAITIGTKAVLSPVNQGSEAVVSILGPWDSDPDSSVLSYLAPMAAGLLGKHVGDTICYHEQEFVVKSISKWE